MSSPLWHIAPSASPLPLGTHALVAWSRKSRHVWSKPTHPDSERQKARHTPPVADPARAGRIRRTRAPVREARRRDTRADIASARDLLADTVGAVRVRPAGVGAAPQPTFRATDTTRITIEVARTGRLGLGLRFGLRFGLGLGFGRADPGRHRLARADTVAAGITRRAAIAVVALETIA